MPQSLHVLLVEDNPDDAELIVGELRRAGFEPNWQRVDTEEGYLARLHDGLDLVLSDYEMPRFSALRALELLKQSGWEVPLIIVSGTIDEDTAVAAMKLGARDYLLKNRLVRLGAAVTRAVAESRLRRERRQATETLRLAHARLRQLLEHSPAVIFMLRIEGERKIPSVISENITSFLGFTVLEALADDWWQEQVHPEDRAVALAAIQMTGLEGKGGSEYRIRHRDGSYRWVGEKMRLVQSAGGEPANIIGVWTDLTEQKRAEEIVQQASGHVERGRRKQVFIELAILATATATIYFLASNFNWFEGVTRWFLAHEVEQMDELILTSVFVAVGLAAFAFRHWRQAATELTSRHQVQAAQALLHEELDRRVKQRTEELGNANSALRREVGERMQVETVLKESNRRFQEMLENVELIAMTLDKKGVVTFCNDFLLQLTGWKREEVIGRLWFDQFLPESGAGAKQVFLENVDLGKIPAHHQNPIKTRTGELREIAWNNTMLRDGVGKIVGTASIGEDITERARVEAALRESEAQFRQVVENIREVFWMTDATKNRRLYISPGYEAIWGRTCESLYAEPEQWMESVYVEDRERVRVAAITKQTRGDYDETYRIVRPDGTVRWIHDRAFPIRNQTGGVDRVVGTAEDITEYRTLEDQFLQAQKMEAIGTLAGGIAHDFNNILAAIIGYSELARLILKENPEVRDHLGSVLQAASRATDLVRQILAFSRQQQPQRRSIQLRPVVEETLKLLRATIPSTIEFDISLATDAPTVFADATQIHQVLMNLGTNAWHAMKDRTGRLQVKLEKWVVDAALAATQPRLRPGVYARVSVGDTGSGMDQATLRRIFEPFFTTKPPGEGTGLGLAVVHGIMDTHDGAVTVYSQPGEGTIFHLYFPADTTEAIETAAEEGPTPRGHGERLLFVDDEELLVRLGQKTLVALGYEVEGRTKPLEALALVRADPQRFALVLVDQTMPGMTGLFLAGQLRQIRPGFPIILMTGYSASLSSERAKAAGVHQLLLKPTTIRSLGAAVHSALSAQSPINHG